MRPALALALALAATPALADEVWTTQHGEIIYLEDRPDFSAVLQVPAVALNYEAAQGAVAHVIIMGLAQNTTERYGLFEGYWVGPGPGYCPGQMLDLSGKPTNDFGRVMVYFDRPDFPTGFTLLAGNCFYDPYVAIRAEAAAG